MAILNFGSLNIDMIYTVDRIVKPGQTILSKGLHISCGGKGFNQSVALARAGAKVFHAGKTGYDGKMLIEKLNENNVDTSAITLSDVPCGRAFIQVDSNGENAIVVYGGSNLLITKKEIENTISRFNRNDMLLLQNEINNLPFIMHTAKRIGMKLALNLAPMNSNAYSYPLDLVDILIINESEGKALTSMEEPLKAIKKLSSMLSNSIIVITLGQNGLLLSHDGKIYKHPSYHVEVADTTGAGDTFTGFFVKGIQSGKSPEDAADFAAKASALCVSCAGSSGSIPRINEVINAKLRLRRES